MQKVKHRLRSAASRGALHHALLFTGPGDRLETARFAAAAMLCTDPGTKPCGRCKACRKVHQGIHPDVITAQDPKHKNLSVQVVRDLRSDVYIRPNEGSRKIYLFPDAALLTAQDQNVLLKVVEEGPAYAAFFFLAENPAEVLQTLRSRCVEVKLSGGETGRQDAQAAEELCLAVTSGRPGSAAAILANLEKKKTDRQGLQTLLEGMVARFAAALAGAYGSNPPEDLEKTARLLAKALTKRQIMHTIEVLRRYRRDCDFNVGVNHVLGALAVELEGFL
jgi:hypothetical protein